MALTPDAPYPKSPGDQIRSEDWNNTVDEIIRLDDTKVNRVGADTLKGPLTVSKQINVGSDPATTALNVNGNIQLKGKDILDAGGTARITINDNGNLELKQYNGITHLAINTAGRVGIGYGLVNPLSTLDINGDIRLRGRYLRDAGGTIRLYIEDNGNTELRDAGGTPRFRAIDNGNSEILNSNGQRALSIDPRGRISMSYDGVAAGSLRTRGRDRVFLGRVSINVRIRVVTGSGTSFTSDFAVGDTIFVSGYGGGYRTVIEIINDTRLRIDRPYNDRASGREYRQSESLLRCDNYLGNPKMIILSDGSIGIDTIETGNDKLDVRGRCYSSVGWFTRNADYAEYFESYDGKSISVGTPVVLNEDGKIRKAKKNQVPIGVISAFGAIVGNTYKEWPEKYLHDELGQVIMEKVKREIMVPKKNKVKKERHQTEKKISTEEVTELKIVKVKGKFCQKEVKRKIEKEVDVPLYTEAPLYDSKGKKKIGMHREPVIEEYEEELKVLDDNGNAVMEGSGEYETVEKPKINPKYDKNLSYVPREERPEWCCVGLLGQLPVRKDAPTAPTWIKMKEISDKADLWLLK